MIVSKMIVPKYQFTEEELRKLSFEFKILMKNYLELSLLVDPNNNKSNDNEKDKLKLLKSIFYEVRIYIRELLLILTTLERIYKISIVDDIFIANKFNPYFDITEYAYKSAIHSLIFSEQEIKSKINNNELKNIECLKGILEQIRRINSILINENK